ncbi:MAG TPA: heme exporter protein CcmB [Fimbriimonadaceae bacterium]|nr:heme exporter protein CcmB [Fimbriimonadaceae bacterium]
MNSTWISQVRALLTKELRTELRSKHGLFTAGLFGFLAVVTIVFASIADKPSPGLAAALLVVALVFSAVVTVPRTLIVEDEQNTFPLLMLIADPSAAYFGKLFANGMQMLAASAVLGTVFVVMADVVVQRPWMFVLGLFFLSLALAGGTSFCGALVLGASNRWLLAGAVALPLLVPVVFLGVVALRCGLGAGTVEGGVEGLVALAGYALVCFAAAPQLVGAVWRA